MMAFAFVMVWKGRRDHPNKAALLWSLGCATLAFFGAGVWGFMHTLHGINYYTHGTQITAAHGHLAFFGAYVSLNLAIFTYAFPILKNRDPYNQVLNMASFWLMAGGMTFMTFVLTFAGIIPDPPAAGASARTSWTCRIRWRSSTSCASAQVWPWWSACRALPLRGAWCRARKIIEPGPRQHRSPRNDGPVSSHLAGCRRGRQAPSLPSAG